MNCIFTIIPYGCIFNIGNLCSAPESHVLNCAKDHKRLVLREGAHDYLIDIFTRFVVESPNRIKEIPGQTGRDILSH